jgi:hypothetical protein
VGFLPISELRDLTPRPPISEIRDLITIWRIERGSLLAVEVLLFAKTDNNNYRKETA